LTFFYFVKISSCLLIIFKAYRATRLALFANLKLNKNHRRSKLHFCN